MTVQAFFAPLLAAYPLLVYPGMVLSIILIGNLASFSFFWLAFTENFRASHLFLIIILVFLADVAGDLLWYALGRTFSGTKFGNRLYGRVAGHGDIEKHLAENAPRWIFLSKYIPFSTFAIIFSAGWAKIPFKKFWPVSLTAIASSVFVLMLITYGLSTGLSGLEAVSIFKHIERLLAVAVLLFLLLNFVIAKLVRRVVRHGER